jgi:hypothetical protein
VGTFKDDNLTEVLSIGGEKLDMATPSKSLAIM